jgi:hypothetical protein
MRLKQTNWPLLPKKRQPEIALRRPTNFAAPVDGGRLAITTRLGDAAADLTHNEPGVL